MDAKKILFADDDPEIREVLQLLLTSEGYQVEAASNGEELLSRLPDSGAGGTSGHNNGTGAGDCD